MSVAVGSLMQSDPIFNLKAKGEKENEEDYVFGPGPDDGTVYGCLRRKGRTCC
jgi:hypothetical protein